MSTKPLESPPPPALIDSFNTVFKTPADFVVRVPARAVLLGAHVDYSEGHVLSLAFGRYVWLAAKVLPTPIVSIRALDLGEDAAFRLTNLDEGRQLDGSPLPGWARYAAGVAWSMQEEGQATPGMQATVMSEIPIGAGLASSGAVEVAYALAFAQITGWDFDRLDMAKICRRAENDYVGTDSDLTDQFASLFGREGHALLLDSRTWEWEAVPLPEDAALVIADTGTRRTVTESTYQTRQLECRQAVDRFRTALPHVTTLRDVPIDTFFDMAYSLPIGPRKRAEHVITEINRVLSAVEALQSSALETVGMLMDESMVSSRDLYESSSAELNAMWDASQGAPGRLGGRFQGAGTGGALTFLVRPDEIEGFINHTAQRYQEITGLYAELYPVPVVSGARVLMLNPE